MKVERIPKFTLTIGIISLVAAYIIPPDSLKSILGQGLRPMGLVSIFINPVLGIIGSGFSIYKKQWLFLILNLIMIFTFFVIMLIGYAFK